MNRVKTNDKFSEKRKKMADRCDPEIKAIISKFFKCGLSDIVDQHGINDRKGIDCIVKGDKYLQIKNPVYLNHDTLTIPCDDYEHYKKIIKEKELTIFHSYYDKNSPDKIKQYVILKFSDLIKINHDGVRKRKKDVVRDGTEFYWWYYKTIKNIILEKSQNIQLENLWEGECLLD